MKKYSFLILTVSLLNSYFLSAQYNNSKITYNVEFEDNLFYGKTYITPFVNGNKIIEVTQKKKPVNFHLLIKDGESLFQAEYDLPTKKKIGFTQNKAATVAQHHKIYYYDVESKKCFFQSFWTKKYLVHLPKINWELSKETKQIGEYLCYKATTTIITKQEKRMSYQSPIVAWYTPSIKIPFGVQHFNDLPGLTIQLILDHEEGKVTFTATEIDLNSSEEIIINKPMGDKELSQEEYIEILKKLSSRR